MRNLWQKYQPEIRIIPALVLLLAVLAGGLFISIARAVEPDDNGAWSSDQTALQGFVGVYAHVGVPAVVFYWFTYDESGNQAWFISENIPVNGGRTEDTAALFKPVCVFADDLLECERGDAVGLVAVSDRGGSLMIRFGISAIEGFGPGCAAGIRPPVLPSPTPPPLPSDLYPCQGTLVVDRITPKIPQLAE